MLQSVCHPFVCQQDHHRNLRKTFDFLTRVFEEDRLSTLFQVNLDRLTEQFLKRRTGILSDNLKVRHIAKNVLVFVSWAGLLEKLLPQMVPIFEYKPIQMLNKMEFILKQEFDTISHYDLMFYSEMSKDLMKLFSTRDVISEKIALRIPDES